MTRPDTTIHRCTLSTAYGAGRPGATREGPDPLGHVRRDAGRVLADIGHPDAPKLVDSARQYREAILRAYRWPQARSPVVPRGDGTWVPAQPPIFFIFGNVGGFFPGEDGRRSWCKAWNMACHSVPPLKELAVT